MDGLYPEVVLLLFLLISLISAIFIRYRWYSFIKLHGASLCSVCSALTYCAYACLFEVELKIIMILVWLFWICLGFSFLGIGVWCFPCVAVVFVSFSWITCYLSGLINRDIWRGIFAASSGRLCWIFKFLSAFFSVSTGVLLQCYTSRGNLSFALVEYLLAIINLVYLVFSFFHLFCLLTYIIFLLFQLFRLGHRTVWRGCWTGLGGKDEIWWGIWRQFLLWSLCYGSL